MQSDQSHPFLELGTIEMEDQEDSPENQLGLRIRQIRTQQQMSAKELGDRVGVSRSMISQIELGRTNASVSVLKAIARELGIPLFTLFVEEQVNGEIVRKDQRPKLHVPGSDIVRELLVPDTRRKMTLISAKFAPGDRSSYEPSAHKGEECIVVLEGTMQIYYSSELITLEEGDSFYFDSTLPHIFANESTEMAEVIVSMCY